MKEFKVINGYNGRDYLILTVGSNTRNPTGKPYFVRVGEVLKYESSSDNGNVWFHHNNNRIKAESGHIRNMVSSGIVSPV